MLFADRIDQAVKFAERERKDAAVIFLDLDHFKEINDTLGHHHGDLLLRTLGPRLREVLRDSDTVARLGGDEFGILLPDATPTQASHVAGKVLSALKRPLQAEGLTLQVGASMGIACYPTHGHATKNTGFQTSSPRSLGKKPNSTNGRTLAASRASNGSVNVPEVEDQFTISIAPTHANMSS